MRNGRRRTAGEDLHRLIEQLTPSERRYISLYGSVQKRDPEYLQLFRFLATQPRYDEEAIRKKFAGASFLRNLSVARAYLRSAIMRSLRAYHDSSDLDARLRQLLGDVAILVSKRLVDQALVVLDEAEELAVESERDLILLQILEERTRLDTGLDDEPERSGARLSRQESILDRRRCAYELEHIRKKLDALYFVNGGPRSEEDERRYRDVLEHPLLRESDRLTRDSRLLRHSILATAAYADEDFERAEEQMQARRTIFDRHPRFIEERPGGYVAVLTNLIVVNMKLKRFAEADELFTLLEAFPDRVRESIRDIEPIELQVFRFGAGMRLAMHFLKGEYDLGCRLVPSILLQIDRWGEKLSDYDRVRLYFQICCIRYGAGDFHGSLQALRMSIANTNWRVRTNVTRTARFVELILLFELGDISMLEYRVEALRRLLQRKGMYHRTESTLLRAFATLPNLLDTQTLRSWFCNLYDALSVLQDDPHERSALSDFPFLDWLERKSRPGELRPNPPTAAGGL